MMNFKNKANLIWEVADLLRGDYKQSDYGKVILPLTVLRRLDCVLAPSKQKVLDYLPKVKKLSDHAKDVTLNKIAGFNFHNRSQFDFAKLIADPNHIAANLRNHINGYSASAREIIEYFNFDDQIERMDDPKADILFQVVKKFGEIDLTGMETMQMGYVFEDLIRRFAEQSNETAIGDELEKSQAILADEISKSGKTLSRRFDMEPFKVLIEMIRENTYTSIDGAVQIAKIHPPGTTEFLGVYWPSVIGGKKTFLGKNVNTDNNPAVKYIDPDTGTVVDEALPETLTVIDNSVYGDDTEFMNKCYPDGKLKEDLSKRDKHIVKLLIAQVAYTQFIDKQQEETGE